MAKTIQQMMRIEAPSSEDFVILFNDTMKELANAKVITCGEKEATIIYDEAVQISHDDRYCCECARYDWGKGCPCRKGHIQLKDKACVKFTVTLEVE